jgi:hypothetical protein
MTATPTIHLWNPIVGADLVATIDGGTSTIDVPLTLAAGVAADCGNIVAALFLQSLIEESLRNEPLLTVGSIDERLCAVFDHLGWTNEVRRPVEIRTVMEPDSIIVVARTDDALPELIEPDFPTIKSVPGWSSKTTGHREPVCSPWRPPAIIMARAGGRPGWAMSAGRNISGALVKTSASDPEHGRLYTLEGWPQIVITMPTEVTYIDVEWDLAERATGEVARMKLARAPHPLGHKPTKSTASEPSTKAPAPEATPAPVPPERTMDRLMVSSERIRLVQVAEEGWEVLTRNNADRFDELWKAVLVFEKHVSSGPVTYHVDIDELLEEAETAGSDSLFLDSPDGRYCIAGVWMPAPAAFQPADVMTYIGRYGKWGYFVHLYRWQKTYLYSWDEGWEIRQVGWESLGTTTRKDAVETARSIAHGLSLGIDEDPLGN